MTWPTASLDTVARARILAATIPSAVSAEAVLATPFERTWSFITDFEASIPAFDTTVRRVRVTSQDERSARLVAYTTVARLPWPFEVDLEPGWCLMRGRFRGFVVVMAAVPEGEHTRFVHVEGIPLPGTRLLRPLIRRMVEGDLGNLGRLLGTVSP